MGFFKNQKFKNEIFFKNQKFKNSLKGKSIIRKSKIQKFKNSMIDNPQYGCKPEETPNSLQEIANIPSMPWD